jgi:hypothetical protein
MHAYFGRPVVAQYGVVRDGLWTESFDPAIGIAEDRGRYVAALLEQYKIYVEMADRVSARRGLTNTFFLTVNTAALATVGVFWNRSPDAGRWLLLIPLLALLVECQAWFWLVRSYRQLNTAKYIVVGALEERLPASPYWRAEWKALGEGLDSRQYLPLSHLEQWIPLLFGAIYVVSFAVVLVQ